MSLQFFDGLGAYLIGGSALCFGLAACIPAAQPTYAPPANLPIQLQQVSADINTACSEALLVANIAGLVPGVGAIVPYINAACTTAEGISAIAASPTGVQWLGQLIGEVKALASQRGMKL